MDIVFKDSEWRREYAKVLVREITSITHCTPQQAKEAIATFSLYLQTKISNGQSVDLGFMQLEAKTTRATAYTMPFVCGEKIYMVGESKRWNVRIIKSWLRRIRPSWSRH